MLRSRYIAISFVLIILFLFSIFAKEENSAVTILETKRDNSKLREGAGNFYNVIAVLHKGSKVEIIEKGDLWTKVKSAKGEIGWLAENSFVELKSKDIFKSAPENLKMKISSIDATASIRGFMELASNCGRKLTDEKIKHITDEYSYSTRRKFTPDELNIFEKEFNLKGDVKIEKDALKEETIDEDSEFYIGKTAAFFILSDNKIYRDYKLEQYIYFVGQEITKYTPRYEVNFLFVILDRDDVSSFATPGGFIFITKGLLKKLESESELAGVLAHEMSHVIARHGLNAMNETDSAYRNKTAENAFSEFDKEFEELAEKNIVSKSGAKKIKKFEEEFCGYFEEVYKFFSKPRMKADEISADQMGVLYSYKAGYSAGGLSRFLSKLNNKKDDDLVKKYMDIHPPTKDRISSINEYIKKNHLTDRQYEKHLKERYKTRVQSLFHDN